MIPSESSIQSTLPTRAIPPGTSVPLELDASTQANALPSGVTHRTTLQSDRTLFQQVVAAHGKELGERWVLGHQNFVVGPASPGGIPFAPLSHPDGDIYLGFSGPAAAGDGDVVLSNRCQPGYLDSLRSYGLLSHSVTVIEVDPLRMPGKSGWPYSDALARLLDPADTRPTTKAARDMLAKHLAERGSPYFVATFLSPLMQQQADALGLETVQGTDPARINKASFREAADQFGFPVSKGLVLEVTSNMDQLVDLAREGLNLRLQQGTGAVAEGLEVLWLKLQDGSGGDFVQKVSVPTAIVDRVKQDTLTIPDLRVYLEGEIRNALGKVRESLVLACDVNDYGPNVLEKMWPSGSLFPHQVRLICEQDARVVGRVLGNCSNVVLINQDGAYTVDSNFMQITGSDGDYRGSCPFDPQQAFGPAIEQKLATEIGKVAAWMNSLGFRGRFGVDFFVVEGSTGEKQVLLTEVNGRSPISGVAKVIADKLGAPAWINVNIEAPEEINSMDDFRRIFGKYAEFTPGDFSEARVIPQALRAMWGEDGLIQGSAKAKVLLVGPSLEACHKLREELSRTGFIL